MEIVRASLEDLDIVLSLYDAMIDELARDYTVNMVQSKDSLERFYVLIKASIQLKYPILLAKHPGTDTVIGALFWAYNADEYEIEKSCIGLGTYVRKDFRSSGVGSMMRERGIEILRRLKVRRIITQAHEKNKASSSWFKKNLKEVEDQIKIYKV